MNSLTGQTTDRGFTMREHLDEMGLVHMNGRIYDPLIGRFMSADPILQAPGMLQSHNRYSYVMNNPLNLTDPSGFSWWTRFRDKILKPVVFAYIGYLTGGLIGNQLGLGGLLGGAGGTAFATGNAALTTLGSVVAGAGGGFVAGALSTGTLEGGLRGAFSGGVFGGIGASGAANGWSTGQYVAAHAAGGCITSVASGGACGSGAASAAFGKFTTIAIGDLQGDFAKGVASTVAGGVGSVIAGGKFENGAVTAAYGYLFNFLLSRAQALGPTKESFDLKFSLANEQNALGSVLRGHGGRLYDAAVYTEGIYDQLKCWNTDCFGTNDLPQNQRAQAISEVEAGIRKLAPDSTWNMSREMTTNLLKLFESVPNFIKYYGTAESIMNKFEIKSRSTCAPRDTSCTP
jgi:RHS repeat-associated protein